MLDMDTISKDFDVEGQSSSARMLGSYIPVGRRAFVTTPQKIIGEDGRTKVADATEWPFCTFGRLHIVFPNKTEVIASGTLIGSRSVLTAGHCVFDKDRGGWAVGGKFTPALDGASAPFGFADFVRSHSVSGWVEKSLPDFDIAIIKIAEDIGLSIGSINMDDLSDDSFKKATFAVTGYPGDKAAGNQMYSHQEKIKSLTPNKVFYEIDTMGGQSGAPLWVPATQGVAGVHTTGGANENSAVRLNAEKMRWIRSVFVADA